MPQRMRSRVRVALVVLAGFGTAGIVVAGIASAGQPTAVSPLTPRLAELAGKLGGAESSARLEAFWRELDIGGTPLIERIPEKPGRVWMTFVWRAQDGRSNLNAGIVGLGRSS